MMFHNNELYGIGTYVTRYDVSDDAIKKIQESKWKAPKKLIKHKESMEEVCL